MPSRKTLEHAWFEAPGLIIAAGFVNRLGAFAGVTPGTFLGLNFFLDLTSRSRCGPCVEVGSKFRSIICERRAIAVLMTIRMSCQSEIILNWRMIALMG